MTNLINLLGLFLTARVTFNGKTPALHLGVGLRKRIPLGGASGVHAAHKGSAYRGGANGTRKTKT